MLICPKCKNLLIKSNNQFVCSNKHTFDIAKKGYVNLMLANQKNSLNPGDNEIMINARKLFLEKDYYKPLSEELNKIVIKNISNTNNEIVVLDAGCGEGYYTNNLAKVENLNAKIFGVDISKVAIHKAVKNNKIQYVVSSVNSLPIGSKSVDFITNVFAPFNTTEFERVLKDDGLVIVVCAGSEHLKELKNVLYEKVINLEEKNFVNYMLNKFKIVDKLNLKYTIQISNKEDLQNLFKMTPYFYTSSNVQKDKLESVNELNITCSFTIFVLKKLINKKTS